MVSGTSEDTHPGRTGTMCFSRNGSVYFVTFAVYMAKKELFETPKLTWWIKRLGAFSVNREKPEISTFKTVKDVFKTKWSLGIFPEGGIKNDKKINLWR